MRSLIQHLIESRFDEIVSKSIINCHTKGLHSILFSDRVRMFFADPTHQLYKGVDTVAFHPHHCNIDLVCVMGDMINQSIRVVPCETPHAFKLNRYRYSSKIKEGQGGFVLAGSDWCERGKSTTLHADGKSHLFLQADEIHTVIVPQGESAAWFVLEGHEDPDYLPLSWHPTEPVMDEGLYQPANETQVQTILATCGFYTGFFAPVAATVTEV